MPESTTPHHLLNTSWTLHRLSPLHHGKEFQTVVDNPTALSTYAARLRDQLTGDVLAGLQQPAPVPAGEDDDGLSKIGALKTCTWEGIGMSLLTNEDNNPQQRLTTPYLKLLPLILHPRLLIVADSVPAGTPSPSNQLDTSLSTKNKPPTGNFG